MSRPILGFSGEYRFLSNFWPCPVVVTLPVWGEDPPHVASVPYARLDGPSAEHVFQAAKAPRGPYLESILEAASPGEAKRLGGAAAMRAAGVRLRADWDDVKVGVMLACLRYKFRPGTEPAGLLLATGCRMLVEGNTWGDRTWGAITMTREAAVRDGLPVWRALPPDDREVLAGENWLGRLLMLVRAELDCGSPS